MAEILRSGAEWLIQQMLRYNSREIVYRQGTQTSTIRAVVGRTEAATMDETAARTIFTDRDYICRSADLYQLGIVPRPGDRIEDGNDVYEVLPTGTDPGFSVDPYGVIIRIHTKQVSHA